MGLFDKKYCDICGEKIGLFGTRKAADGILCKDCAGKLSPWFDDRRESTLEELRTQLDYRERNREELQNFTPTAEYGEEIKVVIDEEYEAFLVTDSQDYEEDNPDVFFLDEVVECNLEVEEEEEEELDVDDEGNDVSYDPPRFNYTYDFHMQIVLDHPFLEEIHFKLNEFPLEISWTNRSFLGLGEFNPEKDAEYRKYMAMADAIMTALTGDEEDTEDMEEEPEEEETGSDDFVVCPYCDTRMKRTDSGRCPHCGGYLD